MQTLASRIAALMVAQLKKDQPEGNMLHFEEFARTAAESIVDRAKSTNTLTTLEINLMRVEYEQNLLNPISWANN
jgi:hypothetical protein